MSIYVYIFVWTYVFIPLGSIWGGYNLGSRIAGPCGNSMFKLLWNYQTVFHRGCTILHSRQQYMRVPISDILVSTCYNCLFNYAILTSVKWYLGVILSWVSLMANGVEHLFSCLLAISRKDLDARKDWRQEKKGVTGWDCWMASPTQRLWVWANLGR